MPINLLRTVGKIPLDRIDTTGATDRQVPTYDLATNKLVWGAGGGGFEVVGVPTAGQVPKWNPVTSQWEPGDDLTATARHASVQSDYASTDPDKRGLYPQQADALLRGVGPSLTGLPTLFSGDYGQILTNQPDIDDVLTGTPTFTGNTLSFSSD